VRLFVLQSDRFVSTSRIETPLDLLFKNDFGFLAECLLSIRMGCRCVAVCVAVCCSVLQCVAVCVAVCVAECVAVCCSVY